MSGYIPDIIKEAARNLRKNMTESENILWKELKLKQTKYKFLRQKPIYLYTENSGLDRYIIPDFCCIELKLIIEVDGNIHLLEEIYQLDIEKEKLLNQKGYKVLRFTNLEIKNNLFQVITKINSSFP